MLEVDRAESRGQTDALPGDAIRDLIEAIGREREAFLASTASVTSSRVEDVEKSFTRLLSDLQRAAARCNQIRNGANATR